MHSDVGKRPLDPQLLGPFGFTVTTSNGNYSAPAVTCSTP